VGKVDQGKISSLRCIYCLGGTDWANILQPQDDLLRMVVENWLHHPVDHFEALVLLSSLALEMNLCQAEFSIHQRQVLNLVEVLK